MIRYAPASTSALRRPLVQDALLGTVLAVLSIVSMWTPSTLVDYDFREPDAFGVLLALLGSGAVLVRSRLPIVALGVALVALLPMVQLGYSQAIGGLPVLLTLYSVAVRRRFAVSLASALVTAAAIAVVLVTGPIPSTVADWIANAFILATGWSFGRTVRSRRARLATLDLRDRALASAEEAERRTALIQKRAEVAQELQDLVAHSLTEITVQMAAARRLIATDPELADQVLTDGEAAGRAASQEMRRLFRIMAEHEDAPQLRPMPDLASVPDLAAAEQAAGMQVVVHDEGPARNVSAGLSLTAYRIIEEALVNARRHAGAEKATVRLNWSPAELVITVVDDGGSAPIRWSDVPEQSTGGLRRLARRTSVYGGDLRWGRRSSGGFAVTARLPLREMVSPS